MRALHSSNLLAELDDDLRRILSLFARGHDHEKICQVMALPTAELEAQIDEIKQKLRVPSLMDAMRMIID